MSKQFETAYAEFQHYASFSGGRSGSTYQSSNGYEFVAWFDLFSNEHPEPQSELIQWSVDTDDDTYEGMYKFTMTLPFETEATDALESEVVADDTSAGQGLRTNDEITELKLNWSEDPCWDIENTEGFEAHYAELLAWRVKTEAESSAIELDRQLARANELKIDVHVLKIIETLEARITELEDKIESLESDTSVLNLESTVRRYLK